MNELREKKGIYVLVLDKYKQVYVGQSMVDIFKRIKRHWQRKIEFENLLIGKVNKTKFSIDSFGILDTTRIYVELIDSGRYNVSAKIDERERYLVNKIPDKFLLNKVGGGIKLGKPNSFEEFISTYKQIQLE